MTNTLNRRTLVVGLASAGAIAISACGQAKQSGNSQSRPESPPEVPAAQMTVYRDSSCGCCGAWAEIARQAGYQVSLVDRPDMAAIKTRLGVPAELASCHTATLEGFAIEGHVPLEQVDRLLKDKPNGIRGIAVAGMPRGSPGMEMPDGSKDDFQVMAFDVRGQISVFKA